MYRLDIQGLRAIAVISVLIFHADPSWMPGGFIGVDIFFVISGYLITSIILKNHFEGNFSFLDFYRKRIRRIFPALFVVLFFCLCVGYFYLPPKELKELSASSLSTVFFFSNILFWKTTGYFDGAAELKPLLHTWSLSVEEQFYIFYPLALALYLKRGFSRLPIVLLALLICSLVFSEVLLSRYKSAAYFLTPSRAYELLIGAILATRWLKPVGVRVAHGLSVIGLVAISVPLFLYDSTTSFPGVSALLPCLGVALIIYAGQEYKTIGGKLISNNVFGFFGKISYSLYLWHWVLFSFYRNIYGIDVSQQSAIGLMIVSIVAATFSYYLIERPAMGLNAESGGWIAFGLGVVLLISFVSGYFYYKGGVPGRYSLNVQNVFKSTEDFNHRRSSCHGEPSVLIPYSKNCIYGKDSVYPDTAIWGDSHGAEPVVALGNLAAPLGRSVMQITASGCPPALNFVQINRPNCASHNMKTLKSLVSDKNIKTIILATNYLPYKNNSSLSPGYEEVVNQLVAADKKVVLLFPIPNMKVDPASLVGKTLDAGSDITRLGLSRNIYDQENLEWRNFLTKLVHQHKLKKIDPVDALCDSNICYMYKPNVGVLYFDSNHLGLLGSKYLIDNLYSSYGID